MKRSNRSQMRLFILVAVIIGGLAIVYALRDQGATAIRPGEERVDG